MSLRYEILNNTSTISMLSDAGISPKHPGKKTPRAEV